MLMARGRLLCLFACMGPIVASEPTLLASLMRQRKDVGHGAAAAAAHAPESVAAALPTVAVLFVGQFIRHQTLMSDIAEHFGAARCGVSWPVLTQNEPS